PRAAGGPMLGPTVQGLSIVPIAPFSKERRRYVVDTPVTLEVTRDEGDVTCLVDGVDVGTVTPYEPLQVFRSGSARFVSLEGRSTRLEKT
ncbi:MAG: hypothetical protein ABEI52_12805, partial [Halobacteriaceae archaeon]